MGLELRLALVTPSLLFMLVWLWSTSWSSKKLSLEMFAGINVLAERIVSRHLSTGEADSLKSAIRNTVSSHFASNFFLEAGILGLANAALMVFEVKSVVMGALSLLLVVLPSVLGWKTSQTSLLRTAIVIWCISAIWVQIGYFFTTDSWLSLEMQTGLPLALALAAAGALVVFWLFTQPK